MMPCYFHSCRLSWLIALGALVGLATLAHAQDRVEVARVQFNAVRVPGNTADRWLEFEIELMARPDSQRLGRVTDRLTVSAILGYDRPVAGGKRQWEFYRSKVELVGLPSGRATVRFYLPPEIVRRDGVEGTPKYWIVELTGEALEVVPSRNLYSVALSDDSVRKQFLEKVVMEGAANDGILRPQALTPFATAYPQSTSTLIRSESWR